VESENTKVAIIPGGRLNMELTEPLSSNFHVGIYLEKHGEGLHLISYRIPDISEAIMHRIGMIV